ncbi:glycosyltransferase [Halobacillus faecis]|uniref:Glycosyl transferase group 1 n=1 Tax=Halobacillus faecis TaxID=360184 RepID=A0A511WTZ5_9BACI|nr:glycosyltransferase [Halobacillus faecis]GEN54616.1 glycosyl transferase group 1 [Halobacillus faecis]
MNILFIVRMDEYNRAGLFVATHNRVKRLLEDPQVNGDVYSLKFYDSAILVMIKKLFKKNINQRKKDYFLVDGVRYNNLYIRNTLLTNFLSKVGIDFPLYKNAIKTLNTQKYNITIAHWGGAQGSFAYYLKKYKNLPYTLTVHGSDVHTLPRRDNIYKKYLLRNINHSDAPFFVSNQLKLEAEKLGWDSDNQEFHITYNAVNPKIYYQYPKKLIEKIKSDTNTGKYVVGFVGSLTKIKRAEYLIEIFDRIQESMKDRITFFIIGDGPLKTIIDEEVSKSNIDVRLNSNLNQETLAKYYNIFDCLVLPSVNEGLGNVILESQACGTPVVATNTGGIPEIISTEDNLVPNTDTYICENFTKKVVKVISENTKKTGNGFYWEEIVENEKDILFLKQRQI